MHYSIMFAICGIIYIGMLTVSYLSRNKINTIQTKAYKYMLISNFIFFVFQIISVTVLYQNGGESLVKLFWRICWGGCIVWYALFYYYAIATIKKDSDTSFLKFCINSKVNIFMTIVFGLGLITYLFILPFAGLDINKMTFLPGKTAYIVWAFCFFINIVILFIMISNLKKLSKREIFVISFSMVITLFLMGAQVLLNSISIIPLGFAIEMYFLFTVVENPDVILVEENKKVESEINKIDDEKKKVLLNIMNSIHSTSTSINDNINNLKGKVTQKSLSKNLDDICDLGNNFLEKSNALYNLFNIDNMVLNEVDYYLADLLNNVCNETIKKIDNKRIKFSISVSKDIPNAFHGDYEKIYQILLNILINSATYTRVGKIIVNVTGKGISDGYELTFAVLDTGEGIKEDTHDILDISIDNEDNSRGIGLLISKEYVNFLNGKIWYESSFKVGTTFHVKLNQKIVDNVPIGDFKLKVLAKTGDINTDYSGKTILIIDDNQSDIEIFKRHVKNCNFTIVECNSATECINKLKMEEKFDMIFVDDVMPGMGGVETYEAIKTLCEVCPPVIITTSNAFPGIEKFYKDKGFSEYLSKPYEKTTLEKILNKYF